MNSNIRNQVPVPLGASSGENIYNWLTFDKSEQKFYFFKNNKLVGSGPFIYNKQGKPENGVYEVQKITPKEEKLKPVFIGINGVVGISGPGENNEYGYDIENSINSTITGLRVPMESANYFMHNLRVGDKIEVRN